MKARLQPARRTSLTAVGLADSPKSRPVYSGKLIRFKVDGKDMADRKIKPENLRSRLWFNNPDDAEMTALYTERYLNYGLTRDELRAGKPIIGIAQTDLIYRPVTGIIWSWQSVCGTALSLLAVCHGNSGSPDSETGKRPTAMLDKNLAYLSLVESLYGYPIDGVVLMIGCDKTTPALLMAAATVDIPAIALSVGPMLNGCDGERTGQDHCLESPSINGWRD